MIILPSHLGYCCSELYLLRPSTQPLCLLQIIHTWQFCVEICGNHVTIQSKMFLFLKLLDFFFYELYLLFGGNSLLSSNLQIFSFKHQINVNAEWLTYFFCYHRPGYVLQLYFGQSGLLTVTNTSKISVVNATTF